MQLVRFALRRPVTVAMVTIAVVTFGLVAFGRLPLSLLPDLSYPTLTLRTEYPDAAPAEVENLLTRPMESAVGVLPGLRQIRSVSRAGTSEIVLEFEWGRRMDLASLDVRERIERIRLPREVEPTRILRYDPSREPVLRLALWGDDDVGRLRRLSEDQVERRIETTAGVAAVELFGGVEEEIQIEVDEGRLAAYGLTLQDVDRAVALGNVNLPGGTLKDHRTQYLVRTLNEFKEVSEISTAVVRRDPDGGVVRIADIATVSRLPKERVEILRVDGREAVELAVYKEGDANLVSVAEGVRERLQTLRRQLPEGLSLEIVSDRSHYIVDAVAAVRSAALWGAVLAIGVLVMFLRTFSRTLLVALAIPVSVVATFLLMDRSGITLNLMSLGGLALGIGMLVDNAIVVLESIERRREDHPGVEGVERGAGEVAGAVTASTLTTLAVFGPVLFVVGVAGQLFWDLAATVCFALTASLVVSLALIPAASAALLRRREPQEEDFEFFRLPEKEQGWFGRRVGAKLSSGAGLLAAPATWIRRGISWCTSAVWTALDWTLAPLRWVWEQVERRYPAALNTALRHPFLVLLSAGAAFVAAAVLLPFFGAELLPDVRQGEFSLQLRLDEGNSLEASSNEVAAIESRLSGIPEVGRLLTRVGSMGASADSVDTVGENLAQLTILVDDPARREREERAEEAVRAAMDPFRNASYTLRRPTALSLDTPVEVDVFGEDLEAVDRHARILAEKLDGLGSLADVRTSVEPGQPEVLVLFDRDKLAALGLTVDGASQALRHAVRGEIATELRMGDDRIDVRVRAAGRSEERSEELATLVVGQRDGNPVRLASVAELREARGPASIQRLEQQRVARVTASPKATDLGTALGDVDRVLGEIDTPPEVTVQLSGQSEEMTRSFQSLAFALLLAVFLVYVVLASTFESLTQPFVILFAVPLALVGVVPFLWISGHSLSILVLLGSVMLAGIVVNNAIVLVDTANREGQTGKPWIEAVRAAGKLRIRPIFMTTLTTVLGLTPLALGWGQGDELRAPMAVTVIGGLLVSTLLTLFVIPAALIVFRPGSPAEQEGEVA